MGAQSGLQSQDQARRRSSAEAEPLEVEEEFVTVRSPFGSIKRRSMRQQLPSDWEQHSWSNLAEKSQTFSHISGTFCEGSARCSKTLYSTLEQLLMGLRHQHRCRCMEGEATESCREVRISCPDATGLGCDVARMLFDFGLRVLQGPPFYMHIYPKNKVYAA